MCAAHYFQSALRCIQQGLQARNRTAEVRKEVKDVGDATTPEHRQVKSAPSKLRDRLPHSTVDASKVQIVVVTKHLKLRPAHKWNGNSFGCELTPYAER